jgi:putative PIN family toxin of toxin-antitoxin system
MAESAVVDTSVLVSAFLFPRSVPGDVIALAREGRYALHLSPIIMEEMRRSLLNRRLRGSYGHDEDAVEAWRKDLTELCFMIARPLTILPVCRDPDDDHVIAAALAAGAGFIVTGDKDLLALERHENIRILTARNFVDRFSEGASDR